MLLSAQEKEICRMTGCPEAEFIGASRRRALGLAVRPAASEYSIEQRLASDARDAIDRYSAGSEGAEKREALYTALACVLASAGGSLSTESAQMVALTAQEREACRMTGVSEQAFSARRRRQTFGARVKAGERMAPGEQGVLLMDEAIESMRGSGELAQLGMAGLAKKARESLENYLKNPAHPEAGGHLAKAAACLRAALDSVPGTVDDQPARAFRRELVDRDSRQ